MDNETIFTGQSHPGPQKQIWALNYVLLFLLCLTFMAAFLIVYSITQENITLVDPAYARFFLLKIVDVKTSLTIFITLIGLILVRHHFLVGLKPRLVYETKKLKKSSFDNAVFEEDVWQVKLKNVGLGAAVLDKYVFRISFEEIEDNPYEETFQTVTKKMNEKEFHLETDFCLLNLTNGYTIPAKDEKIIFEIRIPVATQIKQFDLRLQFSGFLSGKYQKDIYFLPRLGIYQSIRTQLGS